MASSEQDHPSFNPYRFSVVIALFAWTTVLFLTPGYAGVGGGVQWIIYAVGLLSFLLGCVGFSIELISVYKGREGFLLLVYLLTLLALIVILHMVTVYIPIGDVLVMVLRIIAVLVSLPWLILFFIGVVSLVEAFPAPTNRTDAILTLLGFLGALLPILASIFGSP